jgi:hypothetical protein
MTTTDQVLVIILTTLLSIFLILLIAAAIGALKVVSSVKRVVAKAEIVVDSVESATEVFRDASGPLAFIKIVRNIMKATKRKGR